MGMRIREARGVILEIKVDFSCQFVAVPFGFRRPILHDDAIGNVEESHAHWRRTSRFAGGCKGQRKRLAESAKKKRRSKVFLVTIIWLGFSSLRMLGYSQLLAPRLKIYSLREPFGGEFRAPLANRNVPNHTCPN